ncbi:MAG: GYD domain-containing protein [Chloroflexi bacterium]|nr:MAG: GYD domain-containing protein [Chloroflexota bacterium]
MQTFVSLFRFAPEGMKTPDGWSKKPWERFQQELQKAGGKVISAYGLLGRFDAVIIAEAPDQKTIAKVVLAITSETPVYVETHPAIPSHEFGTLVDEATRLVGAGSRR